MGWGPKLPAQGADGSFLPLESSHPFGRQVGPCPEDSGVIPGKKAELVTSTTRRQSRRNPGQAF